MHSPPTVLTGDNGWSVLAESSDLGMDFFISWTWRSISSTVCDSREGGFNWEDKMNRLFERTLMEREMSLFTKVTCFTYDPKLFLFWILIISLRVEGGYIFKITWFQVMKSIFFWPRIIAKYYCKTIQTYIRTGDIHFSQDITFITSHLKPLLL